MSIDEFEKVHLESEKQSLGILRERKLAEIENIDDLLKSIEDRLSGESAPVEEVEEVVEEVEEEEEVVEEEVEEEEATVEVEEETETEVEEVVETEESEDIDFSELDRDALKAELDKREIEYKGNASKATLLGLLEDE